MIGIALPATPAECLVHAIVPALGLLPERMNTRAASYWLLAFAWQETKLRTRKQYGYGPARGLTQFEEGGVRCVLTNSATQLAALQLCHARGVLPTALEVWRALEFDDVLCFGLCRLTQWADPHPLPEIGDEENGWAFYLRTQNPGFPRRSEWPASCAQAAEGLGHA